MKDPTISLDSRLSRYASIIREQNQRLNDQVEKVLQLARIEKGSFQIKQEPLDLHEVLEAVVPGVQVKVQELGGTLETQFQAQHTRIHADSLHLQNVINNLLDNAIKYSKEAPHIRITTRNVANALQIIIRDEGIGIPKEDQGRVFGKFFRVSTGNVHNVKGFGLGLYYVKSICVAHGWDIRLHSEVDKFTQITIQIPVI